MNKRLEAAASGPAERVRTGPPGRTTGKKEVE